VIPHSRRVSVRQAYSLWSGQAQSKGAFQLRDRCVQRSVGAAHSFDLVDRVQHRAVVPAAELAPNFRQRRASVLPRDVHEDLSRKDAGHRGLPEGGIHGTRNMRMTATAKVRGKGA